VWTTTQTQSTQREGVSDHEEHTNTNRRTEGDPRRMANSHQTSNAHKAQGEAQARNQTHMGFNARRQRNVSKNPNTHGVQRTSMQARTQTHTGSNAQQKGQQKMLLQGHHDAAKRHRWGFHNDSHTSWPTEGGEALTQHDRVTRKTQSHG
jgi:hypothetical protein